MNDTLKIILQPIKFRKNDHIAIFSLNNSDVDEIIREMDDAEWSTGYHFWHLPYSENALELLIKNLGQICTVDDSAFKTFTPTVKEPVLKERKRRSKHVDLTAEQLNSLKQFEVFLGKNNYSPNSVKVFISLIKIMLHSLKNTDWTTLAPKELDLIIDDYIIANKLSINYKNLLRNSVRKYVQSIKEAR